MSNCNKCELELAPSATIKCTACQDKLHFSCGGLTEPEFKKMLPMNMKKWKCPDCKQTKKTTAPAFPSPKPSVIINEQPEDSDNHPSIVSIDTGTLLRNMNEQFQKLSHNITELRTSFNTRLDALTASIDEWSQKYQDLENNLGTVREDVALVKEENQALRSQLELLQKNFDDQEQKSRQCNLEIQNLPEKSSENLIHVTLTLGKVLNVPLTPENIKTVHRVPHHGHTNRPKNIIIELSSRRLRDDVIAAARARRGLTVGQLMQAARGTAPSGQSDDEASTDPVFINEHLTLKNKVLYSNTRRVAKDKQYKWVWIKNGAILVRKADNTKVKRIRCDADLEIL